MSAQDDVNKDSEGTKPDDAVDDATATKKSGDEQKADSDVVVDINSGADKAAADSADDTSSENSEEAGEASVDAASDSAGSDDPLGFGSTRMEGDEEGDTDISAIQAKLGESEARVASQHDQLLRLQAEMENQRKRAQNDVTKAHKFALEKIALDLLPVKDSLEMGLLAATGEDAEPEKIIEGSELTLKMFSQVLERYHIVEVNPVDEKFDPEFHQAMSMQPVEGKESNTVASVMQKGYTLNERLIRPALVMVVK